MFTSFEAIVNGDKVLITGHCVVTGKPVAITVPLKGYIAYYEEGKFIQDAFPDLPANTREYMVSGCSPEGWEKLYGGKL